MTDQKIEELAFEFDRYVNGVLMAEGVKISRQPDLASAVKEAVRLADGGDVLVLRGSGELDRLKAERVKLADDSRAARAFIAELKERMGCLFLERPEMTTARRVRAHVLGVIEFFDRSNHD